MGSPPSWIVTHGPKNSVPSSILALTQYAPYLPLESKLQCKLCHDRATYIMRDSLMFQITHNYNSYITLKLYSSIQLVNPSVNVLQQHITVLSQSTKLVQSSRYHVLILLLISHTFLCDKPS